MTNVTKKVFLLRFRQKYIFYIYLLSYIIIKHDIFINLYIYFSKSLNVESQTSNFDLHKFEGIFVFCQAEGALSTLEKNH